MMDKQVVMGDFRGIKDGSLVRIKYGSDDLPPESVALVLSRSLNAVMLGDGDREYYDEILVLLHRGKRHYVAVDDVELVRVENDVD
jgi:hypothetical protein